MFSRESLKKITWHFLVLALLGGGLTLTADAKAVKAGKGVKQRGSSAFGVVKGLIIDDRGQPLASAIVSLLRSGTDKVSKQVRAAADGSFIAKVLPGTYTVLAKADGYDSVALNDVQVNRSAEIYYGLRMERAGSGRTFAEKKLDRNSPKWRIRAAQAQRSIYQAGEEKDATVAAVESADEPANENNPIVEENIGIADDSELSEPDLPRQTLIESYAASTGDGAYIGLNFATVQPIGKDTKIILAGQTGSASFAPHRLQAAVSTRLNDRHELHLTASAARLGAFTPAGQRAAKELGQLSLQAIDQWQLSEGFILVYGIDYSRFIGAGGDYSITPRFGVQYDLNAKTRFTSSYTGSTEERTWQNALEMENEPILFREAPAVQQVAEVADRPVMNKNRRFDIGFERVLNNNSSIEAAAFFDTFSGRGVGLVGLPMGFLTGGEGNSLVQTVNQSGKAQGVRISYNRRFNGMFSASAGYAFGKGQKLSAAGLQNPEEFLDNAFFQTFMAQVSANLQRGTKVKTIFRLSPEATVFAIDPFAGRMAIYDPSISVVVVQSLPNWGLPFRAEAVLDARNLLDYAAQAQSEDGMLRLNGGRVIRGGISVRF